MTKLIEASKEAETETWHICKGVNGLKVRKYHIIFCSLCREKSEEYNFEVPIKRDYTSRALKKCNCLYKSDCHGIEMIKSPSGKEWAIGGTKTKDRWRYCPWCGGELPNF